MRLYKFTSTKYALQAICKRELKATELDKTNDVYELLPYRWDSKDKERTATYIKHRFAKKITMLCFSKDFSHPLLWGHYANNGEGISLGLEINDNELYEVKYETRRIEGGYRIPQIGNLNEMTDIFPRGLVKSSHWEYEKEWRMWKNKGFLTRMYARSEVEAGCPDSGRDYGCSCWRCGIRTPCE